MSSLNYFQIIDNFFEEVFDPIGSRLGYQKSKKTWNFSWKMMRVLIIITNLV